MAKTKDYLPIIGRNTIAGASTPLVKILINAVPIYTLLVLRQIILFIISIFSIKFSDVKKEFSSLPKTLKLRLLLASILSSFSIYLIMFAYKFIPINIFSILEQSMMLILSTIFGFVFLKERLHKNVYIALIFLVGGLLLVVTKGNFTDLSELPLIGGLIMIFYGLVATAGSTMSVGVVKHMSASSYLYVTNLFRLFIYLPLPFLFKETFFEIVTNLPIFIVVCLVLSALSNYIVDFLNNKSIKAIGYSQTKLFLPLIPLTSSILAMIIFKEWFNMYQYVGTAIILICFVVIIKHKDSAKD